MGRRALVFCLLAVAVGGCGSVPGQGSRDKVRAAVESFLDACSSDEPQAAFEALDDPARRRFVDAGTGLDGCRQILGIGGPEMPPPVLAGLLRSVAVRTVTVRGELATAEIDADGLHRRLELESSQGLWRLSAPPGG